MNHCEDLIAFHVVSCYRDRMHDRLNSAAMTVTLHNDRLIAVRSAYESADCARMRHEADILRRLDHPGLVRLVDHTEGPPARIRTVFVGPDSWSSKPPIDEQVASSLSAALATVADIHDSGLTHGDIRAEHVLVDSAGRPVLCGLARARTADPTTIAADVDALISLGRELAQMAGVEREAIESILATLEAGREDLRGTVRSLDRRRLPPAAPATPTDRRAVVAACGLLAAVSIVAVVAIVVLRSTGGAVPAATASRPLLDPKPTDVTVPTATVSPAVAPADRPTAPKTVTDAVNLFRDGRRYTLGRSGDIIVTGDWSCDGTPTPALLRPETGEVAVFADWPAVNATVPPAVSTVVDGAIDLVATDQECPLLRVATATGSRLITLSESS